MNVHIFKGIFLIESLNLEPQQTTICIIVCVKKKSTRKLLYHQIHFNQNDFVWQRPNIHKSKHHTLYILTKTWSAMFCFCWHIKMILIQHLMCYVIVLYTAMDVFIILTFLSSIRFDICRSIMSISFFRLSVRNAFFSLLC